MHILVTRSKNHKEEVQVETRIVTLLLHPSIDKIKSVSESGTTAVMSPFTIGLSRSDIDIGLILAKINMELNWTSSKITNINFQLFHSASAQHNRCYTTNPILLFMTLIVCLNNITEGSITSS